MDGLTDRRTDQWADGPMDQWTDGPMDMGGGLNILKLVQGLVHCFSPDDRRIDGVFYGTVK